MQRAYKTEKFTLRDYLTWPDDERWEIIDGVAYSLSAQAAPTVAHQTVSLMIAGELYAFLKGKQCRAFASPIDVVFENGDDTDTVVQPDIIVVCDPEKLKNGKRVIGAPDMIVEILSPSSVMYDMAKKSALYERNGVFEYWIVAPEERIISRRILTDGRYAETLHDEGMIASERLPGFELDLKALFAAAAEEQTEGA